MSQKERDPITAKRQAHALAFAALGDETRLALVTRLSSGKARSITELTRETQLTRQAVTKHLSVLGRAGMVQSIRAGREHRFQFDPRPTKKLHEYLAFVSRHWDEALARLKELVEK
jgi:DNA-binding transcriptional ArsR family regulator